MEHARGPDVFQYADNTRPLGVRTSARGPVELFRYQLPHGRLISSPEPSAVDTAIPAPSPDDRPDSFATSWGLCCGRQTKHKDHTYHQQEKYQKRFV
ncbi:hypothetical protein CGMCC3_g1289 [Colletotrichum fructicola]|nr:uncharacterized protein CGMCC3_g1289 [Colletotrichum fructicola]KAE9583117.1 hypothetical protein CGMCC3_g1289 [Colletotrichum fructicola]